MTDLVTPGAITRLGYIKLHKYTVATVPNATKAGGGAMLFVSNGAAGNPIIAYSDGTNWLRVDTATAISAS